MEPIVGSAPQTDKEKRLLDQVRDVMRLKHYSFRTEQTYCDWVDRFIRFHRLRHPREMREAEVGEFSLPPGMAMWPPGRNQPGIGVRSPLEFQAERCT